MIGGTEGWCSTLVHYGVLAVGSPHSSASQPPSPSGKALEVSRLQIVVEAVAALLEAVDLIEAVGLLAGHAGVEDQGLAAAGLGQLLGVSMSFTPQPLPRSFSLVMMLET